MSNDELTAAFAILTTGFIFLTILTTFWVSQLSTRLEEIEDETEYCNDYCDCQDDAE